MTVLTALWNWNLIVFGKIDDLGVPPSITRKLVENINRQLKVKQTIYLVRYGLLPQEVSGKIEPRLREIEPGGSLAKGRGLPAG